MEKRELQDGLELLAKITNKSNDIEKAKEELIKKEREEESNKLIDEWKKKTNTKVIIDDHYFKVAEHLIRSTIKGFSNATILFGEGGIGKTILTLKTIKKELRANEWIYKAGFTTPLAFYRFLFENKEKEVIVLDDVEGLFNNKKSVTILKGCLWDVDGKRLVHYDTSWKGADDLPPFFEVKSKLIVLANDLPRRGNMDNEALLSRTLHYCFRIPFRDKMRIIKDILKSKKDLTIQQKTRINKILDKYIKETTKNLNFRTLERLISLVKYDFSKSEFLFKEIIETDEGMVAYIEISKMDLSIKDQIRVFNEKTGKSRRTFFRIKQKVSKCH